MKQYLALVALLCSLFFPAQLFGQVNMIEEQSKVYLILLDVESQIDISLCYSKKFDKEFVKIEFAYEDSINQLDEMVYLEDPLTGPECFVPEIKLVYKYHTYVISLHCSKVIKYRNQTPWFTSPQRLKNDLILTPSVYHYLNRLRIEHFGPGAANEEFLKNVATSDPLEDMSDYGQELDWLLSEDGEDDDESDLEYREERVFLDDEDLERDLGDLEDDGGDL
jgi:hypothetical protein